MSRPYAAINRVLRANLFRVAMDAPVMRPLPELGIADDERLESLGTGYSLQPVIQPPTVAPIRTVSDIIYDGRGAVVNPDNLPAYDFWGVLDIGT